MAGRKSAAKRSMTGSGKVANKDPRNLKAKHAANSRRPTAARRKPSTQKN